MTTPLLAHIAGLPVEELMALPLALGAKAAWVTVRAWMHNRGHS